MSPNLKGLLDYIRQHDAFQEFIGYVDTPTIRPFVKSKAANVEQSRSEWIFESGQKHQHERWVDFVTGKTEEA